MLRIDVMEQFGMDGGDEWDELHAFCFKGRGNWQGAVDVIGQFKTFGEVDNILHGRFERVNESHFLEEEDAEDT